MRDRASFVWARTLISGQTAQAQKPTEYEIKKPLDVPRIGGELVQHPPERERHRRSERRHDVCAGCVSAHLPDAEISENDDRVDF